MEAFVTPLAESLDRLHDDIYQAVEPLSDGEINWKHPSLSNTVGILLRHVAGSERYWIVQVVGGRQVPRNRDAEFEHEPLTETPPVAAPRRAPRPPARSSSVPSRRYAAAGSRWYWRDYGASS